MTKKLEGKKLAEELDSRLAEALNNCVKGEGRPELEMLKALHIMWSRLVGTLAATRVGGLTPEALIEQELALLKAQTLKRLKVAQQHLRGDLH